MSWYAAEAWVNYHNAIGCGGHTNWRLPIVPPAAQIRGYIGNPGTEFGSLFFTGLGGVPGTSIDNSHNGNYVLFTNIQSKEGVVGTYWTGTEFSINQGAWIFETRGVQDVFYEWAMEYAWALAPASPATLLASLLKEVTGIGPGQSLANKVRLAQTYCAAKDLQATCAVLTDFVSEVSAQTGKKLTTAQAAKFTSDAKAIMAAIGCK